MKKIAKLSLVAAVAVAGLSTSAMADSLAEAFAASKVTGEIKANYFTKQTVANDDADILVAGGNLNLVTGSFNGLTAGVTFQTSHVLNENDDKNAYAGDMDASGSVMSQSYLAYTMANTTAKVGRQYIVTPLVSSSGSRMIKTSWEGLVLANTDIPNTTIVGAYVGKGAGRTDGNGEVGEFNKIAQDGAYTVLAMNKSIKNLALTAQYATVKAANDIDVLFVDAGYKMGAVKLSAEILASDNGAAANSDGKLYGVKADANVAGVALTAAYTTTDDEAAVVRGLGAGAFPGYAKLTIGAGGYSYNADTNSYMVKAGYKIAGVNLGAGFASYDVQSTNQKFTETEVKAAYSFNKALSASVVYADFGKDDAKDYNFRSYVSYKF